MKIKLESVFITVVSPEEPDGTELMLEPNGEHPATKAFKAVLYAEGLPLTAFQVDDIQAEYKRLQTVGVEFTGDPVDCGTSTVVTLDDTCGNWIMIYQEHETG